MVVVKINNLKSECKHCKSKSIVKFGKVLTILEGQKQRFRCQDCARTFYLDGYVVNGVTKPQRIYNYEDIIKTSNEMRKNGYFYGDIAITLKMSQTSLYRILKRLNALTPIENKIDKEFLEDN